MAAGYNTTDDPRKKLAMKKAGAPGAVNNAAPLAPAQIMPPIMPDWSASIRSARGSGETAAPAPNAPTAFSMAVRGMGSASSAAPTQAAPDSEAVRQIQMRRLRDEAQNRYLRGINTPTTGMNEAGKQARIDAILENRGIVQNIEGANAPIQPVQSPSAIVAGRSEINQQLKAVGEAKRQAIMARMKADPANAAKYQAELVDAHRIIQDADKVLPTYGGGTGAATGLEDPRVTAIRQGQTALAARQEQAKAGYAQLAEGDLSRKREQIAQTQRMRQLTGELGIAQGERALSEEQAAKAASDFSRDPETMKAELATKQAMARAKAMQATAEASAYGGPNATTARIAGERRQAAMSMAGLDTPEAYNQFVAQAVNNLSGLGDLAGDQAEQLFNQQTIPVLNEIAASDPVAAARIARDLLSQIPSARPTPGDFVTGPLGSFNIGRKVLSVGRLNRVRQRLEQIAQG